MLNKKLIKPAMLATVAALAIGAFGVVSAQQSTDGDVTVTGGSLVLTAPGTNSFPGVTLDGTNQTITDTLVLGVEDSTGTGAGWDVDMTMSQFSATDSSGNTLAQDVTSITGVTVTCTGDSCTDPVSDVSYPVNITADGTTSSNIYAANADTGLGTFDVTPTFEISVPADSYAAAYSSTITTTLSSGP